MILKPEDPNSAGGFEQYFEKKKTLLLNLAAKVHCILCISLLATGRGVLLNIPCDTSNISVTCSRVSEHDVIMARTRKGLPKNHGNSCISLLDIRAILVPIDTDIYHPNTGQIKKI